MLLEVGRIEKPHGVQGEVIVRLTTNVEARASVGAVLFALVKRGGLEPRRLVVASSRPHQHRWIVKFDGVTDRIGADVLHGAILKAEPIVDDSTDTLWVHELIGREVVETTGRSRGRVDAVIDNPASDLLELESGALVPLRFVVDASDPERLVVDVPDGLFDLADGK